VPVHVGTWDLIAQDVAQWRQRVEAETRASPLLLEPGGKVVL
ncbi:MAG: metal-dependent hydrolase, partial [Planctomycetes bacterium]|nr:metal-dependent hydrolase [Planctomycetota bacterium]